MTTKEGGASAPVGSEPMAPVEAAGYIAELTSELATIARASNLEFLAYLLDLARQEAAATAERDGAAKRRR